MSHYSKKDLKLMLKTNSYPIDAPGFIFREVDRRKRELDKKIKPIGEECDIWMRQQLASKWRAVQKPTWQDWFYKKLGVRKRSKVVNRIKDFFR